MPVTPATSSSRVGSPKKTSAAVAIAARVRRDDELRDVRLDGTLDDEHDGAVLDRLHGEVVTVRPLAGNGEESGARRDRTCVVRKIPHLDGVGAAENRLRCERGYKALELHGATRYRV